MLLCVCLCWIVVAPQAAVASSDRASDMPAPAAYFEPAASDTPARPDALTELAGADTRAGADAGPNQSTAGKAAASDTPQADYPEPAAEPQYGFAGPSYQGVTYSPTSDKPESKLWWNDGFWWADMFDRVSGDWHIFRLDRSTETWVDTGTPIDTRPDTLGDALWDGSHLYVASHVATISTDTETTPSAPGSPALLYRFSYSSAGRSYSLDAGYPATITTWSSESMTIDEDSTGVIWATWTQVTGSGSHATSAVYVNSSASGDASTWGSPFVLPVGSVANPSPDDISALVSYKNSNVGVLWSNQITQKFYWAVHHDGDAVGTWQESIALEGSNSADDHLNVKTLQSDASGRVYAAVKTSADLAGVGSAPLIDLLVFTPGSGAWGRYTYGTVDDCHTRPIVLLDSDDQTVHVFATAPMAGVSCPYTGVPGTIYEKTAPMDNPVFPTGAGTPVIQDPSSPSINDATSTKQQVTAATGIVVIANNTGTGHYWFMDRSPTGPVPPVASFTANPSTGTVPLSVSFTDTSTGNPTSWSWDFGDGSPTSGLQNPSHNYTVAGTYTAVLTATNAGGSNSAQKTITVKVPPPTASFTATPASGTVPFSVSFADTSTGNPTSWSWDFGDGSAHSSLQSPSHNYTVAGTYTAKLTATNSGGSNTAQKTITASTPGVPGKPTGLIATAANVSATVSWTAPADNGSPISGYAVTSTPGSKTCTTGGGLTCVVGGLTNGTSYTFKVIATNGMGPGPASDPSAAVVPHSGATYYPLTPIRLLDSRDRTGGLGLFHSHVAQTFQVTGGSSGVPSGATAVTGNLTVTQQNAMGFLYIGPVAMNNPSSSTLNFPAGDDRANAVTVALGLGGTLSVTYAAPTLGPTAHVIFDLTGYFAPDTGGATYHALTPKRILDSRDGTGATSIFGSHLAQRVQVTGGSSGIPSGATAVTGNLTVTQQASSGFLYIGPDQANNPTSSTLNFPKDDDRANAVTVRLGAGGVFWVTYAAPALGPTAHVIFDVTGYFTPDMTGATYMLVAPTRILDTRDGTGLSGAFNSHVARPVPVTGGSSGVPASATAVTGNLTVTQQTSLGFLYAGNTSMNDPTSSTLNFPAADDRANAITVALGSGGVLWVTYAAPGLGPTAHVILDITGYFTP